RCARARPAAVVRGPRLPPAGAHRHQDRRRGPAARRGGDPVRQPRPLRANADPGAAPPPGRHMNGAQSLRGRKRASRETQSLRGNRAHCLARSSLVFDGHKEVATMKRLSAMFFLSMSLLGPAIASADDAATNRVFRAKCASCHGEDGKGHTKEGEKMKVGDMTSAAFQKELTDEKIKQTIENGLSREKNGVKQEMKPLKDKLTPEQIDALVKYVRGLAK